MFSFLGPCHNITGVFSSRSYIYLYYLNPRFNKSINIIERKKYSPLTVPYRLLPLPWYAFVVAGTEGCGMNSRCVVGRLEEGREVEGDGERRETVHALFFP